MGQYARAMSRRLACSVILLVFFSSFAAAEKPWTEVRSPHFRVLTDASQSDARQVAHEFEQMRFVFVEHYPKFRLEGGAPMLIFAARDEGTAKSLEAVMWKGKGAKPAGVFHHAWEREYVMVRMDQWNTPGMEVIARQTVYHEYTHSVLHLNLHWIPTWLDEGLANFYGYTRFQNKKILVGAPPTNYGQMPRQLLIPLETLLTVNPGSPYYHDEDKVYQFYAESWALVHFMMFGPGMENGERLNRFSALLQQGVEQKKAFVQAFGPIADMEKALSNYIVKFAFVTGVIPSPPQIDEKTFAVRTLSAAETEAELSGFHLWTHDVAGARPLAEQAVKDDPKLGEAHEMLGFVDFSDAKDADALNEFTEAFKLDPTLYLSQFAKTMMSPMATSIVPADEDAYQLELLKVVELNRQFAPAYIQLARLALRRGQIQNAYGLSRKAEELEPTRAGYHTMSGNILLRMGKGAEAGTFAKYVADRWSGSDHNEAVEVWNAIPAEQRPEGVISLDGPIKDTQGTEGRIVSINCAAKDQDWTLTLTRDDKTLVFHRNGPFFAGFTDTIWYGADHFTLCHHLEGLRAVVRFRASADAKYAGDLADVEVRDDLPTLPASAPSEAVKQNVAGAKP